MSPSPDFGPLSAQARSVLRRWDPGHWADWLVPALVAALWALLLAAAAGTAKHGVVRSIVFVGGPVLLLSGLHGRLSGYMHASSRIVLLPLPLIPLEHYQSARRRHVRGSLATLGLGCAAVGLPSLFRLGPTPMAAGLLGDWLVVGVLSFGVEPLIAASSSWAGRRFPEPHPAHRLQRSLGGGWTLPEAVVHLYAPAFGVATAAALAMPLQLGFDLLVDGHSVPDGLWAFGGACLALSGIAYFVAPAIYARGFFQAVPFLAEATRTLAGPPQPDPLPRLISAIRSPSLRLIVAQYWRLTPTPTLRLTMLGLAAAWAIATGADAAKAAVVLVVALLWVVPAVAVSRVAPQRDRMMVSLPCSPRDVDTARLKAIGLLGIPVALALTGVGLAWSLGA